MTAEEIRQEAERIGNNNRYIWNDPKGRLVLKLLEAQSYDVIMLTPYILERIVELFVDAYDGDNLLKWLEKNNYEILNNLDYAEWYEFDELDPEELENMKLNALFVDEDEKLMLYSW